MSKTNMFLQFLLNQVRGYKENRGESRRFRGYYMSNKEDARGDAAKVIDFIVSRMIVFFLAFTVVFLQGKEVKIAIGIAASVVTLYHLISIRLRNKKLEIMKKQKRRFIASQKIYQEILNNTVEELRIYISQVFERTGFINLKHRRNNHNTIVMEGGYNDEKVLITTFIYKNDYFVELKELKEFIYELNNDNYIKGILMTTSDFTKDCYQYLKQEDQYKILLLNKEQMMNLIEKNNMFPTEEEIDELVDNNISRREAIWEKYKASMLANKKSKSYFLLSLFLMATAYYTPYPRYYMAVASGTLTLTLTILVLRILSKKSKEEDRWEILNKKIKEL